MRVLAFSLCLIAAACVSTSTLAAPRIIVKSTKFDISGASGAALMRELDRRGPKHGFLTRAIAQTRYTMNSESDWRHDRGHCTAVRPSIRLDITYIYPNLTGKVPAALRARWRRFIAGVTRHEETHGRLAREMAFAAEKAVGGLRVKDGKGCRRFQAAMKRKIGTIVADYERRQVKFDAVEHRDGGNIEGLIRKLVK